MKSSIFDLMTLENSLISVDMCAVDILNIKLNYYCLNPYIFGLHCIKRLNL